MKDGFDDEDLLELSFRDEFDLVMLYYRRPAAILVAIGLFIGFLLSWIF